MTASIWNPGTALVPSLPPVAPVAFLPGTEALPGITFDGDTDTGLYSPAAGQMATTVDATKTITYKNTETEFHKPIKLPTEVSLASAITCDIGAAASNFILITGTVDISAFGTNYSGPKFLKFADVLTLGHSANLILPKGVSIETTAGDCAIVIPKATAGVNDGWLVVSYQYADGAVELATLGAPTVAQMNSAISAAVGAVVQASSSAIRNRIVNGDLKVSQENAATSFTITAGAVYKRAMDMFFVSCTGANLTAVRSINATDELPEFVVTGLASNTGYRQVTAIESANIADLASKNVTFALRAKASVAKTATWTAYYANVKDTFGTLATIGTSLTSIATGTFNITTAETTFVANFTLPANAKNGVEIHVTLPTLVAAETFTTRFEQLEEGTIADATKIVLEAVDKTLQEARCMRYYYRSNRALRAWATEGSASSQREASVEFRQTMFKAPTMTYGAWASGWSTGPATTATVNGFSVVGTCAGEPFAQFASSPGFTAAADLH